MTEAGMRECLRCIVADFMDSYDEAQARYIDNNTDYNDGMASAYREMKEIIENIIENSDDDFPMINEMLARD